MEKIKIHIAKKSFEQIAPSSSIVGDASPRKLKSCKGISGFILAETFRGPNLTNLELQPPSVRLPEQVSASQEIPGYTSTRGSREPSALAHGACIDSRNSGWAAPLPGTGRYPSYLPRTEGRHPRVTFCYCEKPPRNWRPTPTPAPPGRTQFRQHSVIQSA